MSTANWNFGRMIIPTGDDPPIIRRNWQYLITTLGLLEDAIAHVPEDLATEQILVTEGTSRKFDSLAVAETTFLGRATGQSIDALTPAESRTLIDASAAHWNANELQGNAIQDHAPVDAEVLTWVAGNNQWEPQPAASDASSITYTPNVLTDWDGDADPGDLDDALDQLAERVDDNEISISTHLADTANPHVVTAAQVGAIADPGASTDHAILRWDGATGDAVQDSQITIDDSGNMQVATSDKIYFRDTDIFVHSNADGEATFQADTKVTIGVGGDIELGDGTLRDMFPNTNKKVDLGNVTHKFNDGWFGGVLDFSESGGRGMCSDAITATPPTNAQLITEFGTAATTGAGWFTFLDVSNAHADFYLCVSDGTKYWVFTATAA